MKIVTVTKNLMLTPTEDNPDPRGADARKVVTVNQPVDESLWVIPSEYRRVITSADHAEVPPAEAPLPPVSVSVGPVSNDPIAAEVTGGGFNQLPLDVHSSTVEDIKSAVSALSDSERKAAARYVMEVEGSRPEGPRASLLAAMGALV